MHGYQELFIICKIKRDIFHAAVSLFVVWLRSWAVSGRHPKMWNIIKWFNSFKRGTLQFYADITRCRKRRDSKNGGKENQIFHGRFAPPPSTHTQIKSAIIYSQTALHRFCNTHISGGKLRRETSPFSSDWLLHKSIILLCPHLVCYFSVLLTHYKWWK